MSKRSEKAEDVQLATEQLVKYLAPAKVVYFNVTSVAKSGMSRTMRVSVVDQASGELVSLTFAFKAIGGWSWASDNWSFRIGGCGMDMRFAALDTVARVIGRSGNDFRIESV